MNSAREKHIEELEALKRALLKTKSEHAKRDLKKGIRRKEQELKLYDYYRRKYENNNPR